MYRPSLAMPGCFWNWTSNCVYCHIEIDDGDRDKPVVTLYHCLFWLTGVAFRLGKPPSMLVEQSTSYGQESSSSLLLWTSTRSSYLGVLADEHIDHVQQVLTSLYDAGVTFNQKNSSLFTNHIANFGHGLVLGNYKYSFEILNRLANLNIG